MTDTDQQKARIILAADDAALRAYNRRLTELRGVGITGMPEDNQVSNALQEGFLYGYDHGRAAGIAREMHDD